MPHPTPTVEEIEQDLVALLVQHGEGRLTAADIALDQHLYDCGYVDSLSAGPFLAAILAKFGVTLRESQLVGRFDHVKALALHLHSA